MVMDIHNMMYRTRKAENHYLRPYFLKRLPPYHQTETWLESRNYRVKPMCSYLRLGSKMQCSGCIISEITLLCVLNAFPGFQATLLPAIRGLHSNSRLPGHTTTCNQRFALQFQASRPHYYLQSEVCTPIHRSASKETSSTVGHPDRSLS